MVASLGSLGHPRCQAPGVPQRDASTTDTVSSPSEPSTTFAPASASSSGGYDGFGIASTRIPAAAAERIPLCESSTAAQRTAATPSRRAASRYTSGAGFPRGTSSDDTVTRKSEASPDSDSAASISDRFEDDASASGQRAASRRTAASAP